jgi:hypothetical protein
MSPRGGEKYRRHIQHPERGTTFATKGDFEDAVRRQCRREFLEGRSEDVLGRFLRRLEQLNARVDDEVRAHQALAQLLSSLDEALAAANRVEAKARSAPWVMVSTRALARIAGEIEKLNAAVNGQLNLVANDSLHEADNAALDEEPGFSFCLSRWSAALRDVSWAQRPGHRELVFLALQHTGALGPRRGFRFVAAASLLSGGEVITFRPHATTVAEAIGYESKRMREVALELDLSWAGNLPVHTGPEEAVGVEEWDGFVEWPALEQPPDTCAVDEAA